MNKHGVGGRKRDTERGWAGERENSERCAIQYHMTSKARLCKGAGKGRRYKKGVLISANQTSHLFSLVCTAQTWMFPVPCPVGRLDSAYVFSLQVGCPSRTSYLIQFSNLNPTVTFWPMVRETLSPKWSAAEENNLFILVLFKNIRHNRPIKALIFFKMYIRKKFAYNGYILISCTRSEIFYDINLQSGHSNWLI